MYVEDAPRPGASLRMADVDRPVKWQGNLLKHGPIERPSLAHEPEARMVDVVLLDPGPVCVAPEALVVVPSLAHKLVGVNRKGWDPHGMLFKLVVPSE